MLICLTCLNRFIRLTYASFVREMNYLKFSKICGENVEYSFRSHKGEKKNYNIECSHSSYPWPLNKFQTMVL